MLRRIPVWLIVLVCPLVASMIAERAIAANTAPERHARLGGWRWPGWRSAV